MRDMGRAEAIAFLEYGTRTGKLATVRPDGRPHVTPVWFVVHGDEIVTMTWHTSVKARNLRIDDRAALTVDLQEPPYAFVLVEGTVTMERDDPWKLAIATEIGGRYMGEDRAEEFGRRNAVDDELVLRMSIDRITAKADMAG